MILLPASVRVYVASEPVSMRRSFEGLSNEVRSVLGRDPMSGHLHVFFNRARDAVKILVWTRGGYTQIYKRLEGGRFAWAGRLHGGQSCIEIAAHELQLLLEGIDLSGARQRRRWEPPRVPAQPRTATAPQAVI